MLGIFLKITILGNYISKFYFTMLHSIIGLMKKRNYLFAGSSVFISWWK